MLLRVDYLYNPSSHSSRKEPTVYRGRGCHVYCTARALMHEDEAARTLRSHEPLYITCLVKMDAVHGTQEPAGRAI